MKKLCYWAEEENTLISFHSRRNHFSTINGLMKWKLKDQLLRRAAANKKTTPRRTVPPNKRVPTRKGQSQNAPPRRIKSTTKKSRTRTTKRRTAIPRTTKRATKPKIRRPRSTTTQPTATIQSTNIENFVQGIERNIVMKFEAGTSAAIDTDMPTTSLLDDITPALPEI